MRRLRSKTIERCKEVPLLLLEECPSAILYTNVDSPGEEIFVLVASADVPDAPQPACFH